MRQVQATEGRILPFEQRPGGITLDKLATLEDSNPIKIIDVFESVKDRDHSLPTELCLNNSLHDGFGVLVDTGVIVDKVSQLLSLQGLQMDHENRLAVKVSFSYLLVASSKTRTLLRTRRARARQSNCCEPRDHSDRTRSASSPPEEQTLSQSPTLRMASSIKVESE